MKHIDRRAAAAIFATLWNFYPSGVMAAPPAKRAAIGDAVFTPQYGPGGSKLPVKVKRFSIDRTPVTREHYAQFIGKNPEWSKSRVNRSLADKLYLTGWKGAVFPKGTANYPVVHISYFAASAYCEWAGGRLSTVLEWEYVAQASRTSADGTQDPSQVTEWIKDYSAPAQQRAVALGPANFHGVYDLHGLLWEWTENYNSVFVSGDNREDGDTSKNLFCGSGSMGAADRANYPAFMRYAMRGGLRPDFSLANQGFRCAYDVQ